MLSKKTKVIKPVGYLDMLMLEKNAKKILTDSGGIQKEAYIFKVPCITLRENTEWIETVKDGWNVLAGANKDKIIKMANDFEPKGEQRNVFGDGDASERIKKIIGGLQWIKK
jgi:UDP-N-acetylglucosamine 2-epimerase (non-hydrolysing)